VTAAVTGQPLKDIQDIKAPDLSFSARCSDRASIGSTPVIRIADRMLSESNISNNQDDLVHELEERSAREVEEEGEMTPLAQRKSISGIPLGSAQRLNSISSQKLNQRSILQTSSTNEFIEITPLSLLPSYKITNFEGRISMHFIKETHLSLEQNTMSGMGGLYLLLMIGLSLSFFMK
jgi:hypothetical protein